MGTSEALMNTFSPFCQINCSCDEALQWTKKKLSQAGLRALQTFDLHTARHALEGCYCPHHGTSKCDCQMLVLLVYGEAVEPATLILHGNDGQTWLSLVDSPGQKTNAGIAAAIKSVLEAKLPFAVSNGE
jgi:hypothetical protein